jgi:hypothetical protein
MRTAGVDEKSTDEAMCSHTRDYSAVSLGHCYGVWGCNSAYLSEFLRVANPKSGGALLVIDPTKIPILDLGLQIVSVIDRAQLSVRGGAAGIGWLNAG